MHIDLLVINLSETVQDQQLHLLHLRVQSESQKRISIIIVQHKDNFELVWLTQDILAKLFKCV